MLSQLFGPVKNPCAARNVRIGILSHLPPMVGVASLLAASFTFVTPMPEYRCQNRVPCRA